jgi:CheY-like chemotaxis protein
MNGIIGFTDLLRNNEFSRSKQNKFLDIINSRSKHLLQIINDIVDISKIEANQLTIEKQSFCLNDLMHELYNSFSADIENKFTNEIQLKLFKELTREESYIFSDMIRIRQILTNLLSNALKFTNEGSIQFGYEINNKNSKLKFYVSDTGIGIPKEKQQNIFERFRQADEKPARRYEGTGLGLSISQNLVKLLGGEIWVDSEENKGSTFCFTIPLEFSNKDSIENRSVHHKHDFNWKGKTILVVEDDPTSREYIQEILSETQATIIMAENGIEGYKKFLNNNEISIILMDIQLPDKNGREVTQDIRKEKKDLPVIAQTAYAMREDRIKCMEAGCNDYITKPIDKNALLAIMHKYITQ